MRELGLDDWPEISRDLETLSYRRIERWNWQGGLLYALRTAPDRYWAGDYAQPEELKKVMLLVRSGSLAVHRALLLMGQLSGS